jgi:hypothetical protein
MVLLSVEARMQERQVLANPSVGEFFQNLPYTYKKSRTLNLGAGGDNQHQ